MDDNEEVEMLAKTGSTSYIWGGEETPFGIISRGRLSVSQADNMQHFRF